MIISFKCLAKNFSFLVSHEQTTDQYPPIYLNMSLNDSIKIEKLFLLHGNTEVCKWLHIMIKHTYVLTLEKIKETEYHIRFDFHDMVDALLFKIAFSENIVGNECSQNN